MFIGEQSSVYRARSLIRTGSVGLMRNDVRVSVDVEHCTLPNLVFTSQHRKYYTMQHPYSCD